MKTMILDTLSSFNANLRNPMNRALSPWRSFLILPVLAYFALSPQAQAVCEEGCDSSLFNAFLGDDALINNTTGAGNTALGWRSLFSNTDASFSTGVGAGALVLNNGSSNTAVGAVALLLNTSGTENTAVGTDALVFNDIGNQNTAVGDNALFSNTEGTFNTATGHSALFSNTTGDGNTANGQSALFNNVAGDTNTAIGFLALPSTTGSNNIGLGAAAGFNMTTADNVISIGSPGDGTAFTTGNRCFIGNIRGVSVGNADGINVIIDSDGQLGTSNSSRRFKKDIRSMDQASEAILGLKPVTFHYKNQDTKKAENTPQFGLIAEEVAEVNPDLVVRDADGKPFTVRYEAVNAMLLNEFLKEHQTVQELKKQVAELTKGLQKVSAQLEANKPAPQVVNNNQ